MQCIVTAVSCMIHGVRRSFIRSGTTYINPVFLGYRNGDMGERVKVNKDIPSHKISLIKTFSAAHTIYF